jgi:hypothetical protein
MAVNRTLGQVREIPKDAEKTRIIPVTLITATRGRDHAILNPNKCQLENFRKNPVISYMHNLYGDMCNAPDPDDVIGMDKGVRVETVSGKPALIGYPCFEPASINLKADKIFRKLLLGSLNAFSVGFLDNRKGKWGTGNEAEGKNNETYYFDEVELIEYSVVNIPSNADGVKRAQRSMRENTYNAILYAYRKLEGRYRLSEIENMRVCDVLNLLDGKDLQIKEKNPEKVKKMLSEKPAQDAINAVIDRQMEEFRKNHLKN